MEKKMRKSGFTLLEMLVVIGIIAILSGASILGYSKVVKSAKKAKTQELVANTAAALSHLLAKNDGVWPKKLVSGANGGKGRLDADTARVFLNKRYYLLGLAYNQKDAGSAGTESFKASVCKLAGKDRCGIVDEETAAFLKRVKNATAGTRMSTGRTVQDHILYYAIDEDGDGITEAQVDGGGTLRIRATAVVWAAGPDGKVEYDKLGRTDDVYSWRPSQVEK